MRQERIGWISDKEVGNEFNYVYIKYNAENTSDEDYHFWGISEVVLFSEGKQEVIDSDFIDYDEGAEPEYYGKVNKIGEVGMIFDAEPNKIEKVRVVISPSMNNNTFDGGTDEQIVEFNLSQK